jgi:hypothetical protein
MRRADAGVDTISVNGSPSGGAAGPIDIESNMAQFVAPNVVRIDNGNTKSGLNTATVTQADLDTELNNSFFFEWADGAVVIPAPKVPTANPYFLGRKITYTFVYEGANPANTFSFAGGQDGYMFADTTLATGGVGPFLTDFNSLIAGIVADGRSLAFKIGFEYVSGSFKLFTSNWVCVALAGPWF